MPQFLPNKWRALLLKLFFGVAILAFLFYQSDLEAIKHVLRQVNIWVLLSLPIFYVHTFFKALRWNIYLSSRGVSLGLKKANSIYLSGTFLGLISPGRLGEVYRAWVLYKQRETPIGLGLASVVVDRIADIAGLTLFGICGVFYIVQQSVYHWSFSTTLLICPILTNWQMNKFFKEKIFALIRKMPTTSSQFDPITEYTHFINGIKNINLWLILKITLLTLASILTYCAHLYFIGYVLGLRLSFFEIVGILSAATFINLLPISINGIGTRDAFLVTVLPILGVNKSLALGFALMFSVIFFANTIMSLPFWIWRDADLPLHKEFEVKTKL